MVKCKNNIVLVICKLKYNKIQFAVKCNTIQYNTTYMVLVLCVLKYNALLFIMVDLQIHKKSRIQFT